jgi:hypothetical protein
MQWNGRRQSDNMEDRRGFGGKKIAAGGGIIAIVVVLLQLFGGDTGRQIAPMLNQLGGGSTQTEAPARALTAEEQKTGDFVATILADTEDIWHRLFRENNLGNYQEPKLMLFTDQVSTGCGDASAAVGPFYCPADQKLYIDMAFFEELKNRFGAQGGDFAIAYVIGHEIGHHIQTLLGTNAKVHQLQQQGSKTAANRLSVALELQADFYAGVWAHYMQKYLDADDIDEAMSAAQAVGDDSIQKRVQGHVEPDSFTHGTSAQRKEWLLKGFQTGDINQGDTFKGLLN